MLPHNALKLIQTVLYWTLNTLEDTTQACY